MLRPYLWLSVLVILPEQTLLAFAATCPLTAVRTYTFGCGVRGTIHNPSPISTFENVTSNAACAQKCLDDENCHSLRRIAKTSTCVIYDKYLDEMSTQYEKPQPGYLWNRECWTTNCDIIDSCAATESCTRFRDGGYDYQNLYEKFRQYACSYGNTAQTSNQRGKQYVVDDVSYFDASVSACDAISQCTQDYERNFGTRDLHFHIPSNQWECITYEDYRSVINNHKGHPKIRADHVSRTRYTVKNDSIGAGYGFMFYGITCKAYQGYECDD